MVASAKAGLKKCEREREREVAEEGGGVDGIEKKQKEAERQHWQ